MGQVTDLWRHPIKGVGREQVKSIALEAGKTMPWDRHWAIAHQDAQVDLENPAWARCMNFARAARGYRLMAVSSQLDKAAGSITLTHPDLETITVNPDNAQDAKTLVAWVTRISDPERSLPAQVYHVPGRGMTDSGTANLSILSNASLAALSRAVGGTLDQRRFRGNIWLDGFDPWEEFSWIGKHLRIGGAEFEITEPIKRCMATTVNPDTGQSDRATLDTLQSNWEHKNFGVFGVVCKAGRIAPGDTVEVL